jgi:hypothetical protein
MMPQIITSQELNFSQRNGLQKINEVLQVNSMSPELRVALFNFVYKNTKRDKLDNSCYYFEIKVEELYCDFFKKPLTEIPHYYWDREERFKEWFFSAKWNEIYDFFEFCFSKMDFGRGKIFTYELNSCLAKENSGYRMVSGYINQITDEREIEAIKESFNNAQPVVKEHLSKAMEFLQCHHDGKEPDFRNSIKESISAVEHVVRDITGASTLGDGLNKLEKKDVKINVCLKEAFDKLYAYTNSEDGIRHAKMNNSNTSFEEAKFMLVACSAFINYITFKQSQLKN